MSSIINTNGSLSVIADNVSVSREGIHIERGEQRSLDVQGVALRSISGAVASENGEIVISGRDVFLNEGSIITSDQISVFATRDLVVSGGTKMNANDIIVKADRVILR